MAPAAIISRTAGPISPGSHRRSLTTGVPCCQPSHTLSEVALHLNDGRVVRKEFDVGIPMTDLAAQGASLTQKFMGLAEPVIGARAKQVAEISNNLGGVKDVGDLMALVAKGN